MLKKKLTAIAIKSCGLLVLLGMQYHAMGQGATTTYPKIAPMEQYLMTDQSAEITQARSAAPEAIARDAEVLVFGRHGFETAVKGKNGFMCIVERSWTSAPDGEFWNPKVRTPICYNAAASHSLLPRNIKRTNLILAGLSQRQVDETIVAAVDKKELPAIEPGTMCYMMSKQGYGGDSVAHWPPHVMFYFSQTDPAIWGANLPGSPIHAMSDDHEHLTEFAIGVQRWSGETDASQVF